MFYCSRYLASLIAGIFIVICASSNSANEVVEELSPEIRSLLKKEMLALQIGMQEILPAYVSGDLNTVTDIARRIKASYIFKREITDQQKAELVSKLPHDFLARDKRFHERAGMLEHVAKENHMELVGFYYAKLLESCVSCHSEYAAHRFPNLESSAPNEGHH